MAAPKYPMRLVTRRTGLTSHLIRAWERRHNAVTPQRTDTNRRLYSDDDVDRLILLRDATSAGHSIGQIAELSRAELERLVAEAAPDLSAPTPSGGRQVRAEACLREAMAAVIAFDPERLENILSRAAVSLSQPEWVEGVIVPLLNAIGDRWQEGALGVVNEHLASAVVRTLLGNMNEVIRRDESAPRLVVTTPAGQLHELGALLATVTAASEGWNSTYLGPNLPASEILSAVELRRAQSVGLSLVYPRDDPHLPYELRTLKQGLKNGRSLLVGGRAAPDYQPVLDELGAVVVGNLGDLRSFLSRRSKY